MSKEDGFVVFVDKRLMDREDVLSSPSLASNHWRKTMNLYVKDSHETCQV
jgi:hypothetical protein